MSIHRVDAQHLTRLLARGPEGTCARGQADESVGIFAVDEPVAVDLSAQLPVDAHEVSPPGEPDVTAEGEVMVGLVERRVDAS